MRQPPFNSHPSFGHNKRGLLQHDAAVHLAADMDFRPLSPLRMVQTSLGSKVSLQVPMPANVFKSAGLSRSSQGAMPSLFSTHIAWLPHCAFDLSSG